MLYPLTFRPRFKERIWGGRRLETLYHKTLPPGVPIGESWEITDRPGDVSEIANGPLAGRDLRWLMEQHGAELLGCAPVPGSRFPLLIKILDAAEKLSLQVHPPAHKAADLGGEPKTEMWFIADAAAGAELYAGLNRGVTRAEFERRIHDGSVAGCFHRAAVRPGDAMFLPSGRVHAIGAGNVIFEIQQNSDTTYRVFDWNRVGLDRKPRELHVAQSLASIDFDDFEPALVAGAATPIEGGGRRVLVDHELFHVDHVALNAKQALPLTGDAFTILGVLDGGLRVAGGGQEVDLAPGQFCLVPASVRDARLYTGSRPGNFLRVEPGSPAQACPPKLT